MGHADAIRTGRDLAVAPHQRGPAAMRLFAGDLLLEHRGHQRLDQGAAAPDASPAVAPVGARRMIS